MDKEIKAKWVKALRSGKYKQGQKRLGIIEGEECFYCCLGVLCEINKDVLIKTERETTISYRLSSSETDWFGTLPYRFKEKIGMSNKQMLALVKMNDDQGKSFQEIANYIEANL